MRQNFRAFVVFLCLLHSISAKGQVPNDDYREIIELEFKNGVVSSTDDCTVQWKCLNTALTVLCVKYHNDQWFSFNSQDNDRVYINVINQSCRDLRGVQLIALDGILCRPSTYSLLKCVSLGTNNDFFVRLDDLQPHTDYILIVDGYLNDQCSFQIEVNSEPKGLSVDVQELVQVKSEIENDSIKMNWLLPDSLTQKGVNFNVYRRYSQELKYNKIESLGIEKNSVGVTKRDYFFAEKPEENIADYWVTTLLNTGEEIRLAELHYDVSEKFIPLAGNEAIKLQPGFRKNTPFTILITDYHTGQILKSYKAKFRKKEHAAFEYDVSQIREQQVEKVKVELINDGTGEKEIFLFNL